MKNLDQTSTKTVSTSEFITNTFKLLENGKLAQASERFMEMSRSSSFDFLPKQVLEKFTQACKTQNWDLLSEIFINKDFIGPDGRFIWISPFSIRRQGIVHRTLTGIYGKVLNFQMYSEFKLTKALRRLQNNMEIPGEIISIESYNCFGFTGNELGEAFLVPNGWRLKNSKFGPALNDLRQQRERFIKIGIPTIEKMFDEPTANLLLEWTKNPEKAYECQSQEYQFHEYGHFTGISLNEKIKNKAFLTPWYAAVEEWRSDGVAFDLARKLLPAHEAAQVIAANFCLRFGIDAQRSGGIELDSDVNATLILFDRLLNSGALKINNNFKLSLSIQNVEDLLDLCNSSIVDALELTKSELLLADPRGIWNLYGGVRVAPISRTLFNLFVRSNPIENKNELR